jgi:VanZ family protein
MTSISSHTEKLALVPRPVFWCAAGIILLGLFWVANQPRVIGLLRPPYDKVAHFAIYFALSTLLVLATRSRSLLLLIALTMAVAVADELYQTMVPGRQADLADFLVDTVAICIAVPCARRLLGKFAVCSEVEPGGAKARPE